MGIISLYTHNSLLRKRYCPVSVVRKLKVSHLLEVAQVVQGRVKVGAMSEPLLFSQSHSWVASGLTRTSG